MFATMRYPGVTLHNKTGILIYIIISGISPTRVASIWGFHKSSHRTRYRKVTLLIESSIPLLQQFIKDLDGPIRIILL